jgi:hypothetical protein
VYNQAWLNATTVAKSKGKTVFREHRHVCSGNRRLPEQRRFFSHMIPIRRCSFFIRFHRRFRHAVALWSLLIQSWVTLIAGNNRPGRGLRSGSHDSRLEFCQRVRSSGSSAPVDPGKQTAPHRRHYRKTPDIEIPGISYPKDRGAAGDFTHRPSFTRRDSSRDSRVHWDHRAVHRGQYHRSKDSKGGPRPDLIRNLTELARCMPA